MAELERKYIVPLRKEWLKVPIYKRSKKAVTALREFLQKHMKTEDVRIGRYLNHALWARGMKKPPHKIEVLAKKVEEKDNTYVLAELPNAPKEETKAPSKKKSGKITDKIKDALKAPEDKEEAKEEKKEESEKEKLLEKEFQEKAERMKKPPKKHPAEKKKAHEMDLVGHTGKKGGVETTGRH